MRSNYNDFLTEKERRRCKVFFRLSQILKRRTPDQCRSHHQKLQLKFNDDLPTIMNEVNKKIQKSLAEEMVNNQYHIQRMQMEHMSQMGSNSALDLKIVAQESWYTIRFNNLVTRIEINEENISEWWFDLILSYHPFFFYWSIEPKSISISSEFIEQFSITFFLFTYIDSLQKSITKRKNHTLYTCLSLLCWILVSSVFQLRLE